MTRARSFRCEEGVTLVELLVVIVLLGVVAGASFTVVLSAQRTQRFTEQAKDATDDARLSVERIRQQLRSARLVSPPSNSSGIRFWVDGDQDGLEDAGEIWCYYAQPVAGVSDRYELKRWIDTTADCANFTVPTSATVIARTLRNTDIFKYYKEPVPQPSPLPSPPAGIDNLEPIRRVDAKLVFDVKTSAGPAPFEVNTKVRLRNVA